MVNNGSIMRAATERGVTLIELVTVLTIIGIVASFALPNIDLTRYRVEAAMRGVGTTILAAQRMAVSRQHDVVVVFDLANNTLHVHADADNDGTVDAGERVRGSALGEKIVFGRANAPPHPMGLGPVTFTKRVGDRPAVTFHRSGSASQAGGFYLTSRRALTSAMHARDSRAVRIERATGRVTWFRFSDGTWKRGF